MPLSKERQLGDACTTGNFDLVNLLFVSDPAVDPNWVEAQKSDTPFHRACQFGHHQVVQVLLKHPKINVNIQDAEEVTPLFLASQKGHTEVINAPPLLTASSVGHPEVVALLLAHPKTEVNKPNQKRCTPAYFACQNNCKEVVALLVADKRVDVNKPRSDGVTLLLMACQEGHLDVIRRDSIAFGSAKN